MRSLTQEEIGIVLDFTKFHETALVKSHDLCFTIYSKNSDDQLVHEWIDYFCEAPHTFDYIQYCWYLLEQTIDFATLKNGLHIWCDNAFKQYNLLALLWEMSEHYQIKVSLQFFAPHHGFTLCDAHFGSGKLKLRNTYKHRTIRTTQEIAEVFQQIANTTVIFLEKIPQQQPPRTKLKITEEGSRKYYDFYFEAPLIAKCREHSAKEKWIDIEVVA